MENGQKKKIDLVHQLLGENLPSSWQALVPKLEGTLTLTKWPHIFVQGTKKGASAISRFVHSITQPDIKTISI